jgi:hypothetical protein
MSSKASGFCIKTERKPGGRGFIEILIVSPFSRVLVSGVETNPLATGIRLGDTLVIRGYSLERLSRNGTMGCET